MLEYDYNWTFPLDMEYVGLTTDSMSFMDIDITKQFEIPLGHHIGAFGVERRHDTHGGVDLYCPIGTPVYSVDGGEVVQIRPYTGVIVGSPWWNNTWAISVLHNDGIVVYGEMIQRYDLKVGMNIERGELLGTVLQVLKKDKGRPTSMLHLAMHNYDILSNGSWLVGGYQPHGLLDPTNRLIRSNEYV